MQLIILIIFVFFILFIIYNLFKKKNPIPQPELDVERKILQEHVAFYQKLNEKDKSEFEQRVRNFLQKVRIKGVDVEINDRDKLFVATAAIIPIFGFKDWEYRNIHDVLIYPDTFNHNFSTQGEDRNVLGMIGNGTMQNLMILSIKDLRQDFLQKDTTSNATIHEFVHLIDKDDGYADGYPENLLPYKSSIPWLKRIHAEIELIKKGESDINPYGSTNETEFLAVASEYFFMKPKMMEEKHPELYKLLGTFFNPKNNL